MENSLIILLQLLLAHILTDFVLQPKSWIKHKRKHEGKSYILFLHALLAGFLTYLFLQQANWWYVALFISITHYFIDWWKILQKNRQFKILSVGPIVSFNCAYYRLVISDTRI
jgi:hypothetical protein